MGIVELYNTINAKSDVESNKYFTKNIFENKKHRIGKSNKDLPIILIKVLSNNIETPENLSKFVSISYSQKCFINQK